MISLSGQPMFDAKGKRIPPAPKYELVVGECGPTDSHDHLEMDERLPGQCPRCGRYDGHAIYSKSGFQVRCSNCVYDGMSKEQIARIVASEREKEDRANVALRKLAEEIAASRKVRNV